MSKVSNHIFRIRVSIIASLVILSSGALAFETLSFWREKPENKKEAKAFITVAVMNTERENYVEQLKGYGIARSMRNTNVSSEISGIIKWISPQLKIGQFISDSSTKQALIEIDDRDLYEILVTAQSNLAKAENAVLSLEIETETTKRLLKNAVIEWKTSLRELSRLEGLKKERGISPSDLDKQILQTSTLEKEYLRLTWQQKFQEHEFKNRAEDIKLRKAQLQQAKNDLEKTKVYVPYSGYITEKHVGIGTRVSPGMPLFRTTNIEKIEVPIALPASHYNSVKIGARASIKIRERHQDIWTGNVVRISPNIDSKNRTFQAFIEIEQKKAMIPSGILAIASVDGHTYKNVFVIPRIAMVGNKIFIAKEVTHENKNIAIVEERFPTIEANANEYIIVSEGLRENEKVIVTNVEDISEGILVNIFSD